MNAFKKLSGVAALALALGGLSSVQAIEVNTLKDWAQDAAVEVDKSMTYPSLAISRGDFGKARLRVTINRAGEVVKYKLTKSTTSGSLNSAARRVVNRADFPALPTSYGDDTMTFALELNYGIASSLSEARRMKRQGRTSTEQIAARKAKGGLTASLKILPNQGR